MDARTFAARLAVNALRTGEAAAVRRLMSMFAPEIALVRGTTELRGPAAVGAAVAGQWPMTNAYYRAVWSQPRPRDGGVEVVATFPDIGASPDGLALSIGFDAQDRIVRIEQAVTPFARAAVTQTMPDVVRALVDGALANGTPMVFACTGEDGKPMLSIRGSVQAHSADRLSLWMRRPDGRGALAVRANPEVALLYRDSRTRTTLSFAGRAGFVEDRETSDRIFDLMPEVEQAHDPDRKGVAVLIDLARMEGFTREGQVKLERAL